MRTKVSGCYRTSGPGKNNNATAAVIAECRGYRKTVPGASRLQHVVGIVRGNGESRKDGAHSPDQARVGRQSDVRDCYCIPEKEAAAVCPRLRKRNCGRSA